MINLSPKSDYELVDEAIKGDQNAFTQLSNRYRSQIYSLLLKMVRNKEEAEDLAQEAFLKAFNAISTFNKEYAFSTWLYKIAINNCIDFLRKKKFKTKSIDRPIETKSGEIKYDLPDSSYNPERRILRKEMSAMIQHAIKALPEKYKTVIVLRHIQSKSYEEIAAILDVPLGTVKARIFRAREMLKRSLKSKLFF